MNAGKSEASRLSTETQKKIAGELVAEKGGMPTEAEITKGLVDRAISPFPLSADEMRAELEKLEADRQNLKNKPV